MGIPADEQRSGGALRRAVLDDRLGGRQDVRLVERAVESGARDVLTCRTLPADRVVGVGVHACNTR